LAAEANQVYLMVAGLPLNIKNPNIPTVGSLD
jgi:hypothetical protein